MYILQNRRLSEGYYTYSIEVWDAKRGKLIDYDFCGDMGYWGKEGVKNCLEIESALKSKYKVSIVIECGLLTGKPCPFF